MLQRKRARSPSPSSTSRRARRARTRSPDRALAIQPPTQKAPLPGDLAYIISAQVVGDFLQDIILDPWNASKEDDIGTMLHVSRTFREFTIRFLRLLWGNTFFDEEKMVLTNYKPSVFMLRKIAMIPYGGSRETLTQQEPSCVILDAARYYVDHVISKYARKSRGPQPLGVDSTHGDHLQDIGPKLFATYRDTISPTLRPFLLGRVWHETVKLVRVWRRALILSFGIIKLHWCVSKATWACRPLPMFADSPYRGPEEMIENEIRADIERMRPLVKLSDDELAPFLDLGGALDRLPTVNIQDLRGDEFVIDTLSVIQGILDDPELCKVCAGIVRLAKEYLGMFLSEDEEARFAGPEVTKKE